MMNDTCHRSRCFKQWIVSSAAAAIFMGLFDMVVHGHLLMGMYRATAALWRSDAEMQALFPLPFAPSLLLGMLAATAYGFYRRKLVSCPLPADKPARCMVKKSLCFGLWFGLVIGIVQASSVIYLPIPEMVAITWLGVNIIKGLLLGLVLKFTYCGKAMPAV